MILPWDQQLYSNAWHVLIKKAVFDVCIAGLCCELRCQVQSSVSDIGLIYVYQPLPL